MTRPPIGLGSVERLASLPEHLKSYISKNLEKTYAAYNIASQARRQGFDPLFYVETGIAFDLADRVEHMLKLSGVNARLRELTKQFDRIERVALMLAEEVALGRFGFLSKEDALDKGVRVGLAVVTHGITVAPIQGVSSVKIKKNDDGSSYVAVSFAGPIRASGGTEAAFTLVIADQVRKLVGLDRYRPNAWGEDEVGRFIEELRIYERDVGNFQYKVSDDDLRRTVLNLPVEVDGVETDPVDVVIHRNLRRISTDKVRGGALRVLNDGVIGRSKKLLKITEDLSIQGWEWLAELGGGRLQAPEEQQIARSHFEEVIAGRPVLSLPGQAGGFRLRYGRSYNSGLSTVGVHPSLASLLGYPVVVGTQVKLDAPGKAGTIAFVDSIEPPTIRLKDGSVVRVRDKDDAVRLRSQLDSVLHLGDILICYGDFLENSAQLHPSGYVEEWWVQDLQHVVQERLGGLEESAKQLGLDPSRLEELLTRPFTVQPTFDEAVALSIRTGVPLHPKFLFHWDLVSPADLIFLRQFLTVEQVNGKLTVVKAQKRDDVKRLLEKIGIPHKLEGEQILVEGEDASAVIRTLALDGQRIVMGDWTDVVELLSNLAGFPIRRKLSSFVGVRVGRPEKATPRKMRPPVHVLFPVGNAGGPQRDITQASEAGTVKVDLANLVCSSCSAAVTRFKCNVCGGEAKINKTCPRCGRLAEGETCYSCQIATVPYTTCSFPLESHLKSAIKTVGHDPKTPFKGVKGLTNPSRIPEAMEKGLLRHKHSITMFKDGTARFDATNAPLTHFRPSQIDTDISCLRELGYAEDAYGRQLSSADQLMELYVQDVILPFEAGEYLVNIAKFVDDELQTLYEMAPYYGVTGPKDLIGHLIVGLAPHTSVGVIGRIIGYTPAQVCFAHPYWHSAKRRDCDGDEDAIMLLLDVLLNFSKEFLPAQIGGLMDAPLLVQPTVLPEEVERQAHNLDVSHRYPLEFYKASSAREMPHSIEKHLDLIRKRLGTPNQFQNLGFTHPTGVITSEVVRSSYSTLESLEEKLDMQIELASRIAAVDPNTVVRSVLDTHLLPDIIGNMKAYSSQAFRCKACGFSHRRYPLKGTCLNCEGELQGTVTKGSVEKYVELCRGLVRKFDVGDYLRHRMDILVDELATLFPVRHGGTQTDLTTFLPEES